MSSKSYRVSSRTVKHTEKLCLGWWWGQCSRKWSISSWILEKEHTRKGWSAPRDRDTLLWKELICSLWRGLDSHLQSQIKNKSPECWKCPLCTSMACLVVPSYICIFFQMSLNTEASWGHIVNEAYNQMAHTEISKQNHKHLLVGRGLALAHTRPWVV